MAALLHDTTLPGIELLRGPAGPSGRHDELSIVIVLGMFTRLAVACPREAQNHGVRITMMRARVTIADRWLS